MSENFNIKNIKAIIGLGNPGSRFSKNRHNIGFMIVDAIANKFCASWTTKRELDYASFNFQHDDFSQKIYLVKPLTFMNNSGKVIPFLSKKGIKLEEILVVHDELEKKFGKISIRFGGSACGHNGLRSIIAVAGQGFWRLRFGIDRPEDRDRVGEYVLSNFSEQEIEQLDSFIQKAIEMVF